MGFRCLAEYRERKVVPCLARTLPACRSAASRCSPSLRHGLVVKLGRSSRRLPRPLKASDFATPRRSLSRAPAGSHRSTRDLQRQAFLSLRRSTTHEAERARTRLSTSLPIVVWHAETCPPAAGDGLRVALLPRRGARNTAFRAEARTTDGFHTEVRKPPRGTLTARRGLPPPARSPLVAFLRFQRAAFVQTFFPRDRGRSSFPPERSFSRPGLFHPGNALELPPSRPCSARRSRPLSRPHPPVPLDDRTLTAAVGFEGLIPPSRPPDRNRS